MLVQKQHKVKSREIAMERGTCVPESEREIQKKIVSNGTNVNQIEWEELLGREGCILGSVREVEKDRLEA